MVNSDYFINKFRNEGFSVQLTIEQDVSIVDVRIPNGSRNDYLRSKSIDLLTALKRMDDKLVEGGLF